MICMTEYPIQNESQELNPKSFEIVEQRTD